MAGYWFYHCRVYQLFNFHCRPVKEPLLRYRSKLCNHESIYDYLLVLSDSTKSCKLIQGRVWLKRRHKFGLMHISLSSQVVAEAVSKQFSKFFTAKCKTDIISGDPPTSSQTSFCLWRLQNLCYNSKWWTTSEGLWRNSSETCWMWPS